MIGLTTAGSGPRESLLFVCCGSGAGPQLRSVRTMSRSSRILAVVALCGLTVGCVPIPKKSVVHYGVEGRLTDGASGTAIPKDRISIVVDGREFSRKTNR